MDLEKCCIHLQGEQQAFRDVFNACVCPAALTVMYLIPALALWTNWPDGCSPSLSLLKALPQATGHTSVEGKEVIVFPC